ncbi:MAG: M23 family metallopeptidase [Thermoanaerobaculia bacterium]|nr:M23 family metallopeptidase [Thermoanaerobaculia bacterium]
MNWDESVELHLHPRKAHGRIRTLRLSRRARRFGLVMLAAYVVFLAAGLVLAPRTISNQLLQREYRLRVAHRQQLGERLQALVERFAELARQGKSLRNRVDRIERVYGLPAAPSETLASLPARPPDAPATIFGSAVTQGNRLEAALRLDLDHTARALAAIEEFERAEERWAAQVPARSPLRGEDVVLTSGFGSRRSPYTRALEFHSGIDLAAPSGTRIFAPVGGVVVWAGAVEADRRNDWWRLGLTVVIASGDNFRTVFGHCQEILVRPGMRIDAGDPIATVGDTGWATGPHLHYEIRRRTANGWTAVDPIDYLLDRPLDDHDRPPSARGANSLEAQPLPPQFLR